MSLRCCACDGRWPSALACRLRRSRPPRTSHSPIVPWRRAAGRPTRCPGGRPASAPAGRACPEARGHRAGH
eukprot:2946662-Alexandrium_andersonii.AAC.1